MTDHELAPRPKNEIKTLRKIGYTLETSIADILDNSIASGAKNIRIDIPISDSEEPYISITDDGIGMTKKELISNMRLGCKDPDDEREPGDLGRFGSGMKTASFSQARKLVVISKAKGKEVNAAIWDIDRIIRKDKWILQVITGKELSQIKQIKINEKMESGTQILWLNIDKYNSLSGTSHGDIENELIKDINSIRRTIRVYFHRFLKVGQEDKDIDEINIFINNDEALEPLDPFMMSYKGYEFSGKQTIREKDGITTIQIHNVPHPDLLNNHELDEIGGVDSYNEKQGFYVYRDKRLMIEGDWLKTHASGILGNRARVQVDVPASMDHIWGTDVKKTKFNFPPKVITTLKSLAKNATKASKRDYKLRSKTRKDIDEYWEIIEDPKANKTDYRVNGSNSDIKNIFSKIDPKNKELLAKFLSDLGKNLPLKHILFTMGSNPKDVNKGKIDWKELMKKMDGLSD